MSTLFELFLRFLQKISKSRIDFDDGSYIEYVDLGVIRYTEKDGHRMYMDWIYDRKFRRKRTIRSSSISSWALPHENEPVSLAKQEEIKQKIMQYAENQKVSLEIQQ